MSYDKIITKCLAQDSTLFAKVGKSFKGINLNKYAIKGSCRPTVDRIATNTPGRILRMQDAKDAFVLGNRNGVALVGKQTMAQNPNITLTTSDNFLERFRQMWPDINPAEILKQKAQRYNDLCYLFGKVNIK